MFRKLCFIVFISSLIINQNFSQIPPSKDDEVREGINWVYSKIHGNAELKSVSDLNTTEQIQSWVKNHSNVVAADLRALDWSEPKILDAIDWRDGDGPIAKLRSFGEHLKDFVANILRKFIEFLKQINLPLGRTITAFLESLLPEEDPGDDTYIEDPPEDPTYLNTTKIEVGKFNHHIKIKKNFYFLSKENASWHRASDKCRALGMHLVSLFSEKENMDLHHVMRTHPSLKGKFTEDFWMGGIYTDMDESEDDEDENDDFDHRNGNDDDYDDTEDNDDYDDTDTDDDYDDTDENDDYDDKDENDDNDSDWGSNWNLDWNKESSEKDNNNNKNESDSDSEKTEELAPFEYTWYPSQKIFTFDRWEDDHPLNGTKPCVKFTFRLSGSTWRSEHCFTPLRYVCQKIKKSRRS
ncbi:unnamed protein product [Ceutorhynchus assimilis]|uniref:C-type lectin domain-containing protein n=1 Tax=Ceutorhynchus assimilis TaxID=467358 RepID=A0A9N9QMQ9_9CUCU|nr:unnamed protein product [Ceutorhynchus assimilis]